MSAKKIFWTDPYLPRLVTKITSIEDREITLTETIVYSFAGGQQSDEATLDGIKIVDSRKSGTEIFYTLERVEGLFAGKGVKLEINWEKRYKIMKLHLAAELVLELVNEHYDRPVKFGANINSEKSRVDFIWNGIFQKPSPYWCGGLRSLSGPICPSKARL